MPVDAVLAARLQRIEECFHRVDAEIERFLHVDPQPFAATGYFDPKTAEYVYRARVVRPAQPALSVAIGEFLHNARAALDNVAWQLAGPDPPRGTCFPIFRTAEEYRRRWTRSSGYYATRAMCPEAEAIIEDAQPYHRGKGAEKHPFWVLARLSNEDKHQALHLVGSAVTWTEFTVGLNDGVRVERPRFFRGPFVDGAVIARQPMLRTLVPGEGKVQMNVRFAFAVAFEKGSPARGATVDGTLAAIRDMTLETIGRLAPLLPVPAPRERVERPPHEVPVEQAPPL